MALIDTHAGQILRDLREARGLSPEDLASEIRRRAATAPWGTRGTVDPHTIRRIEGQQGHVPGPRVQFVLAAYFDLVPHEIWVARNARVVEDVAA